MINVLLLEDDESFCEKIQETINKRNNIKLIAKTNSSAEAVRILKVNTIDGIIVDLELHYGEGSGFEFLKKVKELNLKRKPLIIVNTNIISNIIYEKLHKGFADVIFYKKQIGYSPEMVIDSLLLLKEQSDIINQKLPSNLDNESRKEKINDLIDSELDNIGISHRLKGRKYIAEAIYYILNENNKDITAFQYLAKKYKLVVNSINKAIQTAINETWRTSSVEDLKANYTAKINYYTGVPTPTEFIYYYVDKIKKMIENN